VAPNNADLPSRHALPNGIHPNVVRPNNAGLPSQHAHPNAVHPNTVDHPNPNANPARPNSGDLQNPVPSTPVDTAKRKRAVSPMFRAEAPCCSFLIANGFQKNSS
jgi:hypothetical protein